MTRFLGVASVVLALSFFLIPLLGPMPKPGAFVGVGATLLVVAMACLMPASRPVTVRAVAAVGLALCLALIWDALFATVPPGVAAPANPERILWIAISGAVASAYFVVVGPGRRKEQRKRNEDWPAAFYTLPRFRRLPADAKLRLGGFEIEQQQWNEIHKEIALRNHDATPRWRHHAASLGFFLIIVGGAVAGAILNVPFWITFLTMMAICFTWVFLIQAPGRRLALRIRREVLREHGYPVCLECGYNLTGVPNENPCPECGWRREGAEVAREVSR